MQEDLTKQLEDADLCFICGKGDLPHSQCEPSQEELEQQAAYEKQMLDEFSLTGCYGPSGEKSELNYEESIEVFTSFFKGEITFTASEVIENSNWWYFPQTWIGCVGYIIEKRSKKIFCLGSGLVGMYFETNYHSHWAGIKAYEEGKVEPVSS